MRCYWWDKCYQPGNECQPLGVTPAGQLAANPFQAPIVYCPDPAVWFWVLMGLAAVGFVQRRLR